jgi:hypothetical protein
LILREFNKPTLLLYFENMYGAFDYKLLDVDEELGYFRSACSSEGTYYEG